MEQYVGLDVSQQETAVVVIDTQGQMIWRGVCRSTPEALSKVLRQHASKAVKIALETGPLAVWHWHALRQAGFPWSACMRDMLRRPSRCSSTRRTAMMPSG
jgi:transposase